MNQPARRKTDADATSANQSNVTHIFCGKLNVVQPTTLPQPRIRQKAVEVRRFLPIHGQAAYRDGGVAGGCKYVSAAPESRFRQAERRKYPQKRKTRPGGQPDGSSHMGALGVDGRSRRIQPRWGGITAPQILCRGRVAARSNGLGIFLTFLAGDFGRKTTARRADRRRQRPTCRTPWRQGID